MIITGAVGAAAGLTHGAGNDGGAEGARGKKRNTPEARREE